MGLFSISGSALTISVSLNIFSRRIIALVEKLGVVVIDLVMDVAR